MAIKAINNTAGFNGLVPTLLIYKAYLRINKLDPFTLSVTDQVTTIQKVIAEIVKL